MQHERRKKALLAIHAMLRGLELNQIEFQLDEAALREAQGPGLGCGADASAGHRRPADS